MDWCGSSTPRTPEYRTMNEVKAWDKSILTSQCQVLILDWRGHQRPLPFLAIQGMGDRGFGFFMLSKSWTIKIDGDCLIELIRSCKNKVQVYRSVRMPQLHTLLHFHLTPIVNEKRLVSPWPSLEFSKLLLLHPRRGREPIAVSAVIPEALGKSE